MLPQTNLFLTAMRCIPAAEKAFSQMITIHNGDLYFISSTKNAWFKITNFIVSDSNFKITAENLHVMLTVGPIVEVVSPEGSETRKSFRSGSSRIDTGVLNDTEGPDLKLPNVESFVSLPKLFQKASLFNSMGDESTRMSSFRVTSECVIYLIENKNNLCGMVYTGEDPVLEGNFTNICGAINVTSNTDGKYSTHRDLLYLNINLSDEQSIVSCMKLSPPLVTQPAKILINRFILDSKYIEMSQMKLTIDIAKYMEVLLIVSKMDFTGITLFDISDNVLSISGKDRMHRMFEHVLPCECNGNIRFETYMITAAQIKVITSAMVTIKKNVNYKMDLYLLINDMKIIVTNPITEEGFIPFVILPLNVVRK